MARTPNQSKGSKRLIAGATGAGSGTLLVILANNLPETSPLKSWIVILAPSASVLAGGLYQWVVTKISNHFQQKDLTTAIEQARTTLTNALNNPVTTPEHKKELQESLERLEKLETEARMKKVQALADASA